MKLFSIVSILLGAVAFALGQLIELGAPADKSVLYRREHFTAQVIEPASPIGCTQIGIALSLANCHNGICPDPNREGLGYVLYAGPWNPTPHEVGGYYQNFTLQVPEYIGTGPSGFTLTHACLLGGGPVPIYQFLNVSITIKDAPKAMGTEPQTILV